MRNLITDVAGLKVGNAEDIQLGSGTTVVLFDEPVVASVDVRGGGPGTRETELLNPAQTVPGIDAIVLSGGSAFGLDAASGVQAWLREKGRGFAIGPARVPIVPGAVLFDLLSSGKKIGSGSRPIATSAMPPLPKPVLTLRSAPLAPAPGRPLSITKADWVLPRRRRRMA